MPDQADPDRIATLIAQLGLKPHPEGGHFAEVYRSAHQVLSPVHEARRAAVTDIYFLLPGDAYSAFHRVEHDEVWHLYEGAPLEIVEFDDSSGTIRRTTLNPVGQPPAFKHTVIGGNWQAARSLGSYTLVGCTVAPGFSFDDFTLMRSDREISDNFRKCFPAFADLI